MGTSSPMTVGIAGAGLLGRLLAWQLLHRGCRVTLFDAGERDGHAAAAWTAAGMVAPLSEAVVSDRAIYDMGRFAMAQWPRWIEQLDVEPHLWHPNGSLVVAHPQDDSELTQFHRELQAVTGSTGDYQWLSQSAIRALEPDLNQRFARGLLLENEGHLDNRSLLSALLNRIEASGGVCHFECPVNLEPGRIQTASSSHHFEQVIDCRGLGAKPRHRSLRGVRGEILQVQTDELVLSRPVRLMHPRYQLYVVPKPGQRFVIGATQIESEDVSPMSLQSALELGSALYTLAPAFAEARIVEQSVNLRPTFLDNNPHLFRDRNLLSVNGLFRHGYLLAPAMVQQVLAELFDEAPTDFADFLKRPAPEETSTA